VTTDDRELDRLVAEHVFGFYITEETAGPKWIDENGKEMFKPDPNRKPAGFEEPGWTYPHYSTDIAAAWEVVEKFRKNDDVILDYYKTDFDQWRCAFGRGANFVKHKSAPRAICLAALKAKGVSVD